MDLSMNKGGNYPLDAIKKLTLDSLGNKKEPNGSERKEIS